MDINELDWVEVECPKCGRICAAADVTGEKTETDRYRLCPFCHTEQARERLMQMLGSYRPESRIDYWQAALGAGLLVAVGLAGFAAGRMRGN
jgi:hypothetical protein